MTLLYFLVFSKLIMLGITQNKKNIYIKPKLRKPPKNLHIKNHKISPCNLKKQEEKTKFL